MKIFGLVGRSGAGKTTLIAKLLPFVAIASDEALSQVAVPVLDLNDVAAIAAFIRERAAEL